MLQRVLFFLSVLAILASGLGYDPLAMLVPSVAPYTLPGVLVMAFLLVQMLYTHSLERSVKQARTHYEARQDTWHTIPARLNDVVSQTTQLSATLDAVQQELIERKLLLPGELFLLQRRYDEAVKALQQTLEQRSDSAEAHWLLGEALFGLKRYVEALPHLHTGLVTNDANRLTLVAQCEQALGHYVEAEQHLLQLLGVRGEARQEDLVALGVVQSELEPTRAAETLAQALELNPFNSGARYPLIDLNMRTEDYAQAITLATEGLARNPADTGCFVSRAEAYFRRGGVEDEKDILHDLTLAQTKNRKDYNIYRLRGALHQRQATRTTNQAERHRALRQAVEAYEEGLTHVPSKFHAHLLAAESRVLLQLKHFNDAAKMAQRAVEHHPGHVSNHLALALAQLAARQWRAASHATDRGMQWAGWGGRIWLTAIAIFANACRGVAPAELRQKCALLARELEVDGRHFALSETWDVVRDVLQEAISGAPHAGAPLVQDTIALLEKTISPAEYRRTWSDV